MKRLQGNVLTIQRMMTCTYHLYQHAVISIYGWKYQVRHYCAYANGLKCLLRLRAPLFTLQLKLLHPAVSFGKKFTRMRASQFYASPDSFITYTPQSRLESTGSENMFIYFHQRNSIKRKA